jgi:hypothetical protein
MKRFARIWQENIGTETADEDHDLLCPVCDEELPVHPRLCRDCRPWGSVHHGERCDRRGPAKSVGRDIGHWMYDSNIIKDFKYVSLNRNYDCIICCHVWDVIHGLRYVKEAGTNSVDFAFCKVFPFRKEPYWESREGEGNTEGNISE